MLAAVVAAGRFWFASNRVMFHIAIDEPAQLAVARWLSGGVRWNLFDHSTWRPGMGTLMAPLFWFAEDTGAIMRGGFMVAAVLGGLGAVLLARLASRVTTLSPLACVLTAGVVALSPSSLSATSFVWAEALVTVCFVGALLLVVRFYDDHRTWVAVAAIVVGALAFVSHGRLLPLMAIVPGLVVLRSCMRRAWDQAGVLVLAAVVSVFAATSYCSWVFDSVWDSTGSTNTADSITNRLDHFNDNFQSSIGQTWYQLLASGGVIAIGLGVAVRAALRNVRNRSATTGQPDIAVDAIPLETATPIEGVTQILADDTGSDDHRPDTAGLEESVQGATESSLLISPRNARLLLAFTLPLVGVSMVFMSGRSRADHQIYGRYNDAIVWPLLIVGIAWLLEGRRPARMLSGAAIVVAIIGAMLGTGALVRTWHADLFDDGVGVRPMVSGLLPVIGTGKVIPVMTLSFAGTAFFMVVLAAALAIRRTPMLLLVGAVFVVGGAVRLHESLNLQLNSWDPTTEVTEIDTFVPEGAVLGAKFVPDSEDPEVEWAEQRRRVQLYQFALPDRLVLRDGGLDDDVGPYVFAPLDDAELEEAGATIVWEDPLIEFGLWKEPSS